MSAQTQAAEQSQQANPNENAFNFVQRLAADLNKEELDLPGFPEVAAKLHRELASEDTAVPEVVKLINSEPALAARLLQLANSAAFNKSGKEIIDLRTAVTLLGFNLVRSTATSFALKQMQQQEWLKPIHGELGQIWRESNDAAAVCSVVARDIDGIKPDEALVAGLFHLLGRLYILTHAHKDGLDVKSPDWGPVLESWHPVIGRAIVDSWGLTTPMPEAVENQDHLDDANHLPLFSRLMAATKRYCRHIRDVGDGDPAEVLAADEALQAVNLSGMSFMEVIAVRTDDIKSLRSSID